MLTQRRSGTVESDIWVAGGASLRLADDKTLDWKLEIIDRASNLPLETIENVLEGTGWEDEWSDAGGGTVVQRARDAAQALKEHEAEKLAIRAKTARLRAARLARETKDQVE